MWVCDRLQNNCSMMSSYWTMDLVCCSPRTLYWVDAWDRTLKSVDVATRVVRTEADLAVDVADSVVFGVALAGPDTVYVTVWSECNVLAVDLTDRSVKRLFLQRIGTDVLFSVVAPPKSPPQGQRFSTRSLGSAKRLVRPATTPTAK